MGQYVALLDILGFKDIIERNSHEDVIHLFDNFRIYVQGSLADHKSKEDIFGRTVFDISDSSINSNIISDSLVFWTNDNKSENFFELVECLQSLTSFCHNLPKLYLRGGITYGDFFYDYSGVIKGKGSTSIHPIMVGKALVDVYSIEKKLQIAGCIIDNSAIEAARESNPEYFEKHWTRLIDEKKICEYDMPTKTNLVHSWTINWVKNIKHPEEDEIIQGFATFNRRVDDDSVKEKIRNTVDYYKFVKQTIFEPL